jgi:ABC-2 type transport system permease protein
LLFPIPHSPFPIPHFPFPIPHFCPLSTALHTPNSELRTPSVLATLRTWWIILSISLEERLVYRGDFMLGTLMRFLPIVTQIFLWTAVYNAIAPAMNPASGTQPAVQQSVDGTAPTQEQPATATPPTEQEEVIEGYTKDNIIAYFLLTMVARAFSSMPGLAGSIARSIRDGSVKKYITQPVDMIGFLLLSRVAHKLVYYAIAIIPFAFVFYLCRDFFTGGWPDAGTFIAFIASLVMAFLLGYYLETTIGMIGFWFLEVSSLLFVYMLFNFFLSGHMFPIDMLKRFSVVGNITGYDIVSLLPLQYLAYFPSAVFLGKIAGPELTRGLLVEFGWLVFFIFVSRYMFNRGLKRYSAFGG